MSRVNTHDVRFSDIYIIQNLSLREIKYNDIAIWFLLAQSKDSSCLGLNKLVSKKKSYYHNSMLKLAKKNNPKQGTVRVMVFKDLSENQWYGTVLEFNITVSANNSTEAHVKLKEAMDAYLDAASAVKGTQGYPFLNQEPLKEYLELWNHVEKKREVPSPYQVDFHARQTLIHA